MQLEEAIQFLKDKGFLLEDTATIRNNMLNHGKPTNLYRAAICCLEYNNNARSKDLLNDMVVTNWHNLVPLMSKKASNGEDYFSHRYFENGSYWSLTPFGYEMYKAAAKELGDTLIPYIEVNNSKEKESTTVEFPSDPKDALRFLYDKYATKIDVESLDTENKENVGGLIAGIKKILGAE